MMEMGIFCIKMLGNTLILLSGTLLGRYYSMQVQYRYQELSKWKESMQVMYGDISYGGVTFLEIIRHIKTQNQGVFREFYEEVESAIEGYQNDQLCEIWSQSIECQLSHSHLQGEDKERMMEVGNHLGNVDKEQQLAMLQLHINQIDYLIGEMEKDKNQKMKLYKLMGCLGSVFIIILFL